MAAKSGYFLSGDVTRSSVVLYHEYCVQDGNLNACSVSNYPRGVLGARVKPDTWINGPDTFEWDSSPGGGGGGHLGIFWVGMCRPRLQIGTPF